MSGLDRRSLLLAGGALAVASSTGVASARILPAAMEPLIGPGYRPVDADELGMWQQMARVEEEVAGSNLVGNPVRKRASDGSRSMPMIESCGPVIPESVM